MIEKIFFNKNQKILEKNQVLEVISNFDSIERMIGDGKRNKVKIVTVNNNDFNIKAFKTPNLINQIAYKFFRKSKAERSYAYAFILQDKGVKTPLPIASLNYTTFFLYKQGYYITKQLPHDVTYRELIANRNYPNHEIILRAFTRFTFLLHENAINFLDHSPGNTLIIDKGNNAYDFYLIDLNRMKFHIMDFNDRMKNFAKLSPRDEMLEIMCDEYAKLYTRKTKDEIIETMRYYSFKFSNRYMKKEAFKKKYYFWRK